MPVVMLLLSLVLGIVPLAGIAWIIVSGSIMNVDGLFLSLILLTVSGIFFLNASLELRDRGLLPFLRKDRVSESVLTDPEVKKTASSKEPPASKAG